MSDQPVEGIDNVKYIYSQYERSKSSAEIKSGYSEGLHSTTSVDNQQDNVPSRH